MRCESVQRDISGALDGLGELPPAEEEHTAACPSCSMFRRQAERIRTVIANVPATPPDLVPAIMGRIAADAPPAPPLAGRPRLWQAAAIAALVGAIAGFVVTSGSVVPRRDAVDVVGASEIPDRLVGAATSLQGYTATIDIEEWNWAAEVPRRSFVANVRFRAPESFRAAVRDTTPYPGDGRWTPNHLLLVSNGSTWRARGPEPCPVGTPVPCPTTDRVVRTVVRRPPFDPATPMPSDIIAPMTVLAASEEVDLIGRGTVGGRPAVAVALAYQDATPLLGYHRFLGSWRPFFPQDRVIVLIDSQTWFPLGVRIFAAAGDARAVWASQMGLRPDPPGRLVYSATVRALDTSVPARLDFSARDDLRAPGSERGWPASLRVDEGFVNLPFEELGRAGAPPVPRVTAGLTLARYGRFAAGGGSVAAFSRGLAWFTVTSLPGSAAGRSPAIGAFAEPVTLADGGSGYYEPATASEPRRLALRVAGRGVVVATNLPLADLLRIAASFEGVSELEAPPRRAWKGGWVRNGLAPDQVSADASFGVLAPAWLPEGYRPAVAQLMRIGTSEGLTVVFRRPAAELGGIGIRLTQIAGQGLPPPTGSGQQAVGVRGVLARWTPADQELEWVENGVYVAMSAPALDLGSLIRIAESLHTAPRDDT